MIKFKVYEEKAGEFGRELSTKIAIVDLDNVLYLKCLREVL